MPALRAAPPRAGREGESPGGAAPAPCDSGPTASSRSEPEAHAPTPTRWHEPRSGTARSCPAAARSRKSNFLSRNAACGSGLRKMTLPVVSATESDRRPPVRAGRQSELRYAYPRPRRRRAGITAETQRREPPSRLRVVVVGVRLAAAGLGEPTGDEVAGAENRDVQPCLAGNELVRPVASPPLMTAALTRMATTRATMAQNSVVLNACLVSVASRRATLPTDEPFPSARTLPRVTSVAAIRWNSLR